MKNTLIYATLGLALALLAWTAYVGFARVETGEHLEAVPWLPATASNISFYRAYHHTAYEFKITETGFKEWCDWDISEIESPFEIYRYSCFIDPHSDCTATIENGLYYDHHETDGGGVRIAYDRDAGIAYFESSPR